MAEQTKTPTDPQECCDYVNARLTSEARAAGLRWFVTGNPKRPLELRKTLS